MPEPRPIRDRSLTYNVFHRFAPPPTPVSSMFSSFCFLMLLRYAPLSLYCCLMNEKSCKEEVARTWLIGFGCSKVRNLAQLLRVLA